MTFGLIPIIRLALGAPPVFDYRSPRGMRVASGMIVTAPFRNTTVRALVRENVPDTRTRSLKEIQSIVTESPVVDRIGWRFFDWLVEDLCAHPSMVASHIFGRLPKIKSSQSFPGFCASRKKKDKRTLLLHTSNQDLLKKLRSLSNALVLCPSVARVQEIASKLQGSPLLLTHSSGKRVWWNALNAQTAPVVVSTRLGVFLPRHFDHIIVIDEEDPDHKQSDMNPRYDARRIAYTRCALEGSKLTLTSRCPRVVTYAACERGMFILKRPLKDITSPRRITVPPSASSMSPPLVEAMRLALDQKKSVVLFHGSTGFARLLRCDDCGRSVDCSACGVAMRLITATTLSCFRCGSSAAADLNCAHCKSIRMRPIGFGIERIADAVKKEFSDIPVVAADALTAPSDHASVFLATPRLLHECERSYALGLVAIPSIESISGGFGYLGNERMVVLLRKLGLFAHLHGAPFIIQSFSETSSPVTFDEVERWYRRELEERRTLFLPPYGQFFKIILTGSNASVVASAGRLRERCGDAIQFLDPSDLEPRARKRVAKTLYLKLPTGTSASKLCRAIAEIPGAHLDRDPQVG